MTGIIPEAITGVRTLAIVTADTEVTTITADAMIVITTANAQSLRKGEVGSRLTESVGLCMVGRTRTMRGIR